jgi:hypothetical protein
MVTAKDINGCTQIMDISLTSKSPQILISGTINNVKCNGQNNGSILPSFTGGIGPIAWFWNETSGNSLELRNLTKGFYTLNIIDAYNCKAEHQFQVTEPPVLNITATTKPVCAGSDNGFIRPVANGGTPPYSYGVSGTTILTNNTELPVGAGAYNVYAIDSNGCSDYVAVNVETRNTMPLVQFTVATSRYVSDSLVIKEISLPKPDSVSWIFPQEAIVVDTSRFSPSIKFDNPGVYPVTMTGYFGGCDYSVTLPLTIAPYDPDVYAKGKTKVGFDKADVIPNPNNGIFKVDYTLYPKQEVYFKVIDMYSKVWYSSKVNPTLGDEQSIQIPDAPPGTYVLMITCENDAKAVRFIIQK